MDKTWRILTIGDGDLSFSAALAKYVKPRQLVATVFDSESTLINKYTSDYLTVLTQANVSVLTDFDVTNPNTWGDLSRQAFDVVIFQFPLVPNNSRAVNEQSRHGQITSNTRNRWLLNRYLAHCFDNFLAPDGQRLAIITSKDVKPYRQWAIETSIVDNLAARYIGQCNFNLDDFPGYQIRNVDRDKFVKKTQAISYFYTDSQRHQLPSNLTMPAYCTDERYCTMCRVGPITTAGDWQAHIQSKRHRQMSEFEQQWQSYLEVAKSLHYL